jgi:hypothetical protein
LLLSLPIGAATHAAGFESGFEAQDGYTLGAIGGQQGWTGDPFTPADSAIADSAYVPTRALRVTADGGFDGFFHLGAATPIFDSPHAATITASQDVVIDGLGGADFLIQTVDTVAGIPALQVQFTSFGNVVVNGISAPVFWTKGLPFVLAMEHNMALHRASVSINGVVALSGIPLPGISAITQMQFGTDDFVLTTPASLYVDNLSIVPEPLSLGLLAVSAVGLIGRRQRC